MSTDAVTPCPVLWAQRNDVLFLTFNVECKDPEIKITEDSLTFKATGLPEKKLYETTVNFLKKINTENVVSKNSGRCYEFIITKSNTKEDYWKSLTNDSKKPHWLKVDFNKWKDEGSDDDSDAGAGGMPGGMPGGMGGFGGFGDGGMSNFNDLMGQMGGEGKPSFDDLENEDSDDEEIPDLENANNDKKEAAKE
jgi:prostaglandin-E synthase